MKLRTFFIIFCLVVIALTIPAWGAAFKVQDIIETKKAEATTEAQTGQSSAAYEVCPGGQGQCVSEQGGMKTASFQGETIYIEEGWGEIEVTIDLQGVHWEVFEGECLEGYSLEGTTYRFKVNDCQGKPYLKVTGEFNYWLKKWGKPIGQ